jgi:hypothetical protein
MKELSSVTNHLVMELCVSGTLTIWDLKGGDKPNQLQNRSTLEHFSISSKFILHAFLTKKPMDFMYGLLHGTSIFFGQFSYKTKRRSDDNLVTAC